MMIIILPVTVEPLFFFDSPNTYCGTKHIAGAS